MIHIKHVLAFVSLRGLLARSRVARPAAQSPKKRSVNRPLRSARRCALLAFRPRSRRPQIKPSRAHSRVLAYRSTCATAWRGPCLGRKRTCSTTKASWSVLTSSDRPGKVTMAAPSSAQESRRHRRSERGALATPRRRVPQQRRGSLQRRHDGAATGHRWSLAPADGCDAAHPGAIAQVPYTAQYVFYRTKDHGSVKQCNGS